MKIKKLVCAAAACAVAGAALATTAGAEFAMYDDVQPWIDQSAGNYLVILWSDGNAKDDVKAVDLGLTVEDIGQIASAKFTFKVLDSYGMLDYDYGGCVGSSTHDKVNFPGGSDEYATYNWCTYEYYGFEDAALEIDTRDMDKPIVTENLGDGTYSVTSKVVNGVADGVFDSLTSYRIFFSDWGIMSETQVTQADFLDASGNVVISMDGKGNILGGSAAFKDTSDTSADTPADTSAETGASTDTTASADTKGESPDTGVESVAAVAGAAVIAAGAVVLSRKRK